MLMFESSLLADPPQVSAEIIPNEQANPQFQLKHLSSPQNNDAANVATFRVIKGNVDGNSGPAAVLNDGKSPPHADAPTANFFFAPGTENGQLLIDLGEARKIQSVNTYSWHTGERAAQKYQLYGNKDESATLTELKLEEWVLLGEIDTSTQGGRGGQHAVSLSQQDGTVIGEHRYLILSFSPTEPNNQFAQTFLSEIDVIDGKQYSLPERLPKKLVKINEQYQVVLDYSDLPEIQPWVDEKLIPVIIEWYPRIVELLPSDGFRAPAEFSITFHRDMKGVAHASGTSIHCAGNWFLRNLNGEAAGSVVHEMVHIVQQYGRTRPGARNPGWLVEGVADQIRWYLYESKDQRPGTPDFSRAKYSDSYQTTAGFLDYVQNHGHEDLVQRLNAAMREGTYSEEIWKKITGKTVDELWNDYKSHSAQ
ncbi:basic secretory protein-like protein [Planctomicrobium sp. SH668]|uniref:basic secretory protein-like protein n=1 Tax=Planctomicrobium sp. SH668 TaxID=3448126 RepID=UPI003F5BA637